jgi:hypothetical protein
MVKCRGNIADFFAAGWIENRKDDIVFVSTRILPAYKVQGIENV